MEKESKGNREIFEKTRLSADLTIAKCQQTVYLTWLFKRVQFSMSPWLVVRLGHISNDIEFWLL